VIVKESPVHAPRFKDGKRDGTFER
jgi:hypothetical protein